VTRRTEELREIHEQEGLYDEAMATARTAMAADAGLGQAEALRQAASDLGVEDGEEMDAFLGWAMAKMAEPRQ